MIQIHKTAKVDETASVGLPGDHPEWKTESPHPLLIGPRTVIREFCVVKQALADAWSNRGTTIGADCLLMTGVHVYEGCQIDDSVRVHVRATLCGYVDVMKGAVIGACAVIHPGVTIGPWAKIGLGAVVIEDVPPGAVVAGNPARVLSSTPSTQADTEQWKSRCRRNAMPDIPQRKAVSP